MTNKRGKVIPLREQDRHLIVDGDKIRANRGIDKDALRGRDADTIDERIQRIGDRLTRINELMAEIKRLEKQE